MKISQILCSPETLTNPNSGNKEMSVNTMSKSELRKKDPIGQLLDSLCNSSKSVEENIGSAFKPIIKSTTPPTFMPKTNQICSTFDNVYPQVNEHLVQGYTYPYSIFTNTQVNETMSNNPITRFVPETNFHRDFSYVYQYPKPIYQHLVQKPGFHFRENTLNTPILSDLRNFPVLPWMKMSPLQSCLSKPKYFTRSEKQSSTTVQPPRYQCESCNKSYSTFGGLSKHKQFHCVKQVKKEFACKFCGKSYGSLGALKMHIRTHTLPCKCKLCGKAFSRPWLLQGHVRTHTGEKPFRCEHCGRAFADRSNLRAHLQTHSEVKKYGCKNCSKTFSRMSLLVKHKENNNCIGLKR